MKTQAAWQGEWDLHFDHYHWHRLDDTMQHCRVPRPQSTPHSSLQNPLETLAMLQHIAQDRQDSSQELHGTVRAPHRMATPTIMAQPDPHLSPELEEQLSRMLELEPGRNRYGASPIDRRDIDQARSTILQALRTAYPTPSSPRMTLAPSAWNVRPRTPNSP